MRRLSFLLVAILVALSSCKKNETADPTASPVTMLDVAYGTDAKQKMDIYLPAGRSTDSTKVIILVHGGAWVEGDKSEFTQYIPEIKQRLPGYAIVNLNYRLASVAGNFFPSQETDMINALAQLVQKSSEYHISQKFILLGASAGAHMALLQGYKYTQPRIRAIADFFGPTDMVQLYNQAPNASAQMGLQMLLSGTPTSNPVMYQQSSPLNFVDAQDPPTIIFHGTNDLIVDVSHSTALQLKLQSMGVTNSLHTYQGVGHELWPNHIMTDAFNKMEVFFKANVE